VTVPGDRLIDDLNVEALFEDRLVVATGMSSPWAARRRQIDLAELVDEPWILAEAPDSWNYSVVAEAFRARGLRMPRISAMTFSVHLRMACSPRGTSLRLFQTQSCASTQTGARSRGCLLLFLTGHGRS